MNEEWKAKGTVLYSPVGRMVAICVDEIAARLVADLLNVGLAARKRQRDGYQDMVDSL